jgi:hypothetical protein
VFKLEKDGAGEGFGGEVHGLEGEEGAELRREAAGERGGGEADGDEDEDQFGSSLPIGE